MQNKIEFNLSFFHFHCEDIIKKAYLCAINQSWYEETINHIRCPVYDGMWQQDKERAARCRLYSR